MVAFGPGPGVTCNSEVAYAHAPRSRVWRALTDPVQFGQWFGARMPAVPFAPGRIARAPVTGGTLVTVVESGFDKVPSAYRATAFRSNDEGWGAQMENLDRHVAANPKA